MINRRAREILLVDNNLRDVQLTLEALTQILLVEDTPADARLLPKALDGLDGAPRGFHV